MSRAGLCLLVAGILLAPLPALSQIRATQAGPAKKTLEKKGPELQVQESTKSRALTPLPAPEVVKLKCPSKLTYYATDLDDKDPELRGWKVQPVKPVTIKTTLQFAEVGNVSDNQWKGATSIECKYFGDGQKSGGRTQTYHTMVTRQIHPSGTQYRCKAKRRYAPEVECRLSITPDF